MDPICSFDHAVIHVPELVQASADFTRAGFTVTPGGEHEGLGTHNALIAFEDGSYIELLAFRRREHASLGAPGLGRARRWFLKGPGLVDFALLPGNLGRVMNAAGERGLVLLGPVPGGRTRPDGRRVSWEVGVPETFDVPFLCADVTPRELRVPDGSARTHANGAIGVGRIGVVVEDFAVSTRRYAALLGPGRMDTRIPGARAMDFRAGATTITVASPVDPDSPVRKDLNERGEGPASLELWTADPSRAGLLVFPEAYGARISLSHSSRLTLR